MHKYGIAILLVNYLENHSTSSSNTGRTLIILQPKDTMMIVILLVLTSINPAVTKCWHPGQCYAQVQPQVSFFINKYLLHLKFKIKETEVCRT